MWSRSASWTASSSTLVVRVELRPPTRPAGPARRPSAAAIAVLGLPDAGCSRPTTAAPYDGQSRAASRRAACAAMRAHGRLEVARRLLQVLRGRARCRPTCSSGSSRSQSRTRSSTTLAPRPLRVEQARRIEQRLQHLAVRRRRPPRRRAPAPSSRTAAPARSGSVVKLAARRIASSGAAPAPRRGASRTAGTPSAASTAPGRPALGRARSRCATRPSRRESSRPRPTACRSSASAAPAAGR